MLGTINFFEEGKNDHLKQICGVGEENFERTHLYVSLMSDLEQ